MTWTRVVALGAVIFLAGAVSVYAWTGPTQAPPNGNAAAPINVGSTAQAKNGNLSVNGLAVFGNTILNGAGGSYLNFGVTAGTNGYGIRDNSGTLQFKNTGGIWYDLNTIIQNYLTLNGYTSGGGGGTWATSGNDIHNTNAGNVGVGAPSPDAKLYINGASNWTRIGYSSYGVYTNGALAAYPTDGNYWAGDFRAAGSYGTYIQNASGYYSELAYSSWGLYTNGNVYASGSITANSVIHSTSGGIQFPDGTTQTTAAGPEKAVKQIPLYEGVTQGCNAGVVTTNPHHLGCATIFIGYAVK